MSANPLTWQRKEPKQVRSRALVTDILTAAARVFVEDGLDGANTNRIAEVAGVSVGSLYQYFPNKQSLARALLVQHVQQAEQLRPAELRETKLSLPERIRVAVRWQLDVHAQDPALHETLTRIAPSVLGMDTIRAFERFHQRTLRFILESYREELGDRDLDKAAFIVAQTMESLTHGAVLHHPEWLRDEGLADEITDLVVKYLGVQ